LRSPRLDGRRVRGYWRLCAKDRRPFLDTLISDARRRRFYFLVCSRLDHLSRNIRYLASSRPTSKGLRVEAANIIRPLVLTQHLFAQSRHYCRLGAVAFRARVRHEHA
jgi:hypothetical protein